MEFVSSKQLFQTPHTSFPKLDSERMSTGKTYEVSGETTEWEDIMIKKGIKTKESVLIEKGLNPDDFVEKGEEEQDEEGDTLLEALDAANLADLDEFEDDEEFSDNHVLDEYRKRRLDELKIAQFFNRFGDVCEITKADWIRDVTECSKSCWVAVHLYQDSVVECQLVEEAMLRLAPKFKYVKFLKIRSTQAIENWPEKNLPTLFFYHGGELQTQLITLIEVGGKKMTANDLEWYMVSKGVITDSELEEDPRAANSERKSVSRFTGFSNHMSSLGSDDDADDN